MKNIFLCVCFFSSIYALAQGSIITNDLNFSMSQNRRIANDPRNTILYSKSFLVNGKDVVGSPFLYEFWSNGKVTSDDGRIFSGYQLKYDAFNQALHFSDGKDSMESNEPLRSFTLQYKLGDSSVTSNFIFFKKVEKQNKPVFLELLATGKKYVLYKLNKKEIADLSSALPNTGASQYFELKSILYIFNNSNSRLRMVKSDFSNLTDILQSEMPVNANLKSRLLNIHFEDDLVSCMQEINK